MTDSDDSCVLDTVAKHPICAPAKKRQKKDAKILGKSEFPSSQPLSQELTPLQLFEADEHSQASECTQHTQRQASFITDVDVARSPLCASTPKADSPPHAERSNESLQSNAEPSVPLSAVQDLIKVEINEAVKSLRQELFECREQLADSRKDINSLQIQAAHQSAEISSLKQKLDNRTTAVGSNSNLNEVSLTALDVVKVHEYDSETPCFHLDVETIQYIKDYSKSRRNFISNVARKMFSMEERARDCNVAGIKNRALLSPQKTRFNKICTYTAEHYGLQRSVQLAAEVRAAIDDTNRKYRDDLKKRKIKKNVEPGFLVPVQNND